MRGDPTVIDYLNKAQGFRLSFVADLSVRKNAICSNQCCAGRSIKKVFTQPRPGVVIRHASDCEAASAFCRNLRGVWFALWSSTLSRLPASLSPRPNGGADDEPDSLLQVPAYGLCQY